VANGHNFSQVTLLPLLVLSTPGRGVGWPICYIASSAITLYLDYLTSPSLSLHFSSQLPLLLSFAPNPSGQICAVGSPLACGGGGRDRQILIALLSYTTPGECDAEPGIVAASDIYRPMGKNPLR